MKAEVSQTTFTTSRTATLYNILKQQYTQQKFVKNHAILVITLNRPILSCHTLTTNLSSSLLFAYFSLYGNQQKSPFSGDGIASHFKLDSKAGGGGSFLPKQYFPVRNINPYPRPTKLFHVNIFHAFSQECIFFRPLTPITIFGGSSTLM